MTRVQAWWMWFHKNLRDIRGFIGGNTDFGFVPEALQGWMYPIDLDFTLQHEAWYYEPKDAEGLPIRLYLTVGPRYNPTRVAAYGLAHFNRYVRTQEPVHRARFFQVANWFLRAPDGRWRYDFPGLDLPAGWVSAMAQGEGISGLVRAWVLSGDERYLAQARRACAPLVQPLEAGGVRSTLVGGEPFLEEYPTAQPDHVLNGFLYALIGLVDLQRVDPEVVATVGLEDLLNTLERRLGWWDAGFWSLYDLSYRRTGMPNLATVSYHNLHVTQLTFLGYAMQRPRLLDMARRWAEDTRRPLRRWRALWGKIRYRWANQGQR